MKVLHLPTIIAGNSLRLAHGEQELGLSSRMLNTETNPLKYETDIDFARLENENVLYGFMRRLKIFMKYRTDFDIYHFNFGHSLLFHPLFPFTHLDLPFYKKSSKLFVTYNGTDARQIPIVPELDKGLTTTFRNIIKRRGIKKMAKYVNHIWALNPDLLQYLPPDKATFLPYVADKNWEVLPPITLNKKTIRIAHAPTNRAVKGTAFILDALNRLKAKYTDRLEIDLIENVPHAEALLRYKKADIVIDQLMIGWYGGIANEVMTMGKLVAVYINENDAKKIPPDMARDLEQAHLQVTPETLYDALEEVFESPEKISHIAQAGQEYVLKWHAASYVAGITKAAYEKAMDM